MLRTTVASGSAVAEGERGKAILAMVESGALTAAQAALIEPREPSMRARERAAELGRKTSARLDALLEKIRALEGLVPVRSFTVGELVRDLDFQEELLLSFARLGAPIVESKFSPRSLRVWLEENRHRLGAFQAASN